MADEDKDDAAKLTDTLAALESARDLVKQLEERVDHLSLGDYDVLKRIAAELHSQDCVRTHDNRDEGSCRWAIEGVSREPWFGDEHKHWIERAYRATGMAGCTAGVLLQAMETVAAARGGRR